jgi:DNA (cytosine-5)-methyltransferase 1
MKTNVYNHRTRKVGNAVLARIKALKIGQKMQDLPEELWHESFRYYVKEDPTRQGGPNLRMIRLDPKKPSLTVTGYIYNKFVHPYEDRFITPREAARLQGFPDEMEFKGTLTSVQQQIGDAVPVELGKALFQSLLSFVRELYPSKQTFQAISLFSGAGGMDIAAHQVEDNGLKWITYACIEIDKDRCETLKSYFGNSLRVIQKDICQVTAETLLEEAGLNKQDITLIYGGPPCQTFSQAGKQQGTHDPRGNLIFEFLRLVKEISPPIFLMENVVNLKGIAKGKLLADILEEMESLGYRVVHQVINSADYGNAQKRRRLIFIGVKSEILAIPQFPEPSHSEFISLFGKPLYKTVGEAFEGLPSIEVDSTPKQYELES